MKKLYMVNVTFEESVDVPVYADSEKEAERLAKDAAQEHDCDFECDAYASVMKTLPGYYKHDVPEGEVDGRMCIEIFKETNREQIQYEMEESWPKLPCFENQLSE